MTYLMSYRLGDTIGLKITPAAAVACLLARLVSGCHLRTQDTEIDIRNPHDATQEDEPRQKPPNLETWTPDIGP